MFQRNKRRIKPLECALYLRAFYQVSEGGKSLGVDQVAQDKFSDLLNKFGLKDGGALRDLRSGGTRTYLSQLASLGLIHKPARNLSAYSFTQAGEALLDLQDPTEVLQYQILKYQYPSAYSLAPSPGIDPTLRVRPFLLLLELANDPDINGLSDYDIIVPVVYGRKDSDFQGCKEKILQARNFGIEKIVSLSSEEIKTARTKNHSNYNFLKDIANTFSNVLRGLDLVDMRVIDDSRRIVPRDGVMAMVSIAKNIPYVDFLSYARHRKDSLQATLEFGLLSGKKKDTRRALLPVQTKNLQTPESVIREEFSVLLKPPVSPQDLEHFVIKMSKKFAIPKAKTISYIKPMLPSFATDYRNRLIELSEGGKKTALQFEREIERIFRDDFSFVSKWAGSKKRQGKVGGYADVYVLTTASGRCGIIDAKSMDCYNFPHGDFAKMAQTYVPYYSEILPTASKLNFVAYISHLIGTGAKQRAEEFYSKSGIPVVLCSVYELDRMREDSRYQKQSERVTDRFESQNVLFLS